MYEASKDFSSENSFFILYLDIEDIEKIKWFLQQKFTISNLITT